MYDSVEDFLCKIESEGLDYALCEYGLKAEDCPPGEVRDAYQVLENIYNSEEFRNARSIIEEAMDY